VFLQLSGDVAVVGRKPNGELVTEPERAVVVPARDDQRDRQLGPLRELLDDQGVGELRREKRCPLVVIRDVTR